MMKRKNKITSLIMAFAMLFGALALGGCSDKKNEPMPDPVDDNYRSFYQIFVGSFSDSDGDGIGDIRGIINRMDYLNDGNVNSDTSLGVQGLWLSPIFSSPSYHKYDARDYYKLDFRFGKQEDLKELIDLCHERNVKIILDLAINHTSSQHDWFVQFKQARMEGDAANPYYDYYSCATTAEKINGVTYQKISGVDCWYECNFSGDMPELNFDNPEVRAAMLDVAKYYLDLGVDGFRFDAIKYIYYGDTARSVDFWKWYMGELEKIKPDIYCVGECWSGETEILEYYSAMNCFNFAMSQAEGFAAKAARGSSLATFTNYIESFQKKILAENPDAMAMSFLSNHDMDRIAGTFVTEDYMRMAANLYLLSPGSPVIYYGEEIGMRGSRGSENTDANRRLGMLWGDGDTIRNPVGSTYPSNKQISTTVADQMEDENSLYRYYCKLLSIRHRYAGIARGTYTAVTSSHKNVGGFLIEYEGEALLLLHNTSTEEVSLDLSECKEINGQTFSALCDAIGVGEASLEGTVITIGPRTSVILK
ncbi:MAG: hypothetical protein IKC97_07065 [Clostridia bacterium]|nr:hypothetical protein [Clostridia bacterium]